MWHGDLVRHKLHAEAFALAHRHPELVERRDQHAEERRYDRAARAASTGDVHVVEIPARGVDVGIGGGGWLASAALCSICKRDLPR